MPERDHEQEPQDNDALTDQHAGRLPGTEVGDLRKGVGAHAENIRETGEDRKHVTGRNQPRANVGNDGAFQAPPQGVQTDVSAQADEGKPDQKDNDLNKADDGTAVPAEEIGFGTDSEDEQPDERNDDAHPQTGRDGVIRAWAGWDGCGGWEGLVGHKIIFYSMVE